jgi:hypothetical protein
VDRGKDAFEEVLWLDGTVGSTYVCMSNIYADVVEDDGNDESKITQMRGSVELFK